MKKQWSFSMLWKRRQFVFNRVHNDRGRVLFFSLSWLLIFLLFTHRRHSLTHGGAGSGVGGARRIMGGVCRRVECFKSKARLWSWACPSQLIFEVAQFGQRHFSAQLHDFPEHLLCCTHTNTHTESHKTVMLDHSGFSHLNLHQEAEKY